MTRPYKLLRRRASIDPDDVWTPGDVVQMDAVVAGCAMVAQADGWVTPDERKRMIDRMRTSPTIAFFGVDDVLVLFEALNLRFDRDLEDGEATAEVAVSRLRGQSGPSRALIETACAVAEADGGFDAEERAVVLRLCALLDVDPASLDLMAKEGVSQ
ncbi:tellurite resistance terb [Brevundimonas sp. S30B]|uniref:tellurite resistance TerB family protein n=1 Tax=unclassified Brevundimonas TaxID=2622653 RepID=UPI001072A5DD|nr:MULTISPECIES: TerB family tellurite resistance protein [unclassified Brevundimonas]QBX38400.1 tellurite resistance terb [Brevundimonas sp. MF30-B]TFW02109.1 tellurite resistance terb [Brevundimonas sp. S30B]